MYIVYRCKDYGSETFYNVNSVIGLYDNYDSAKKDLISKLNKLKYEYEFQIDDDDYCFIAVHAKSGKKVTSGYIPCFEIYNKSLSMNEIKLK